MSEFAPLPQDFYLQPTIKVAQQLLGRLLVYETPEGSAGGIIVETEAYLAHNDPGCHAAIGRTKRNAVMFGPPGCAYVYRIHRVVCVNIVTAPEDIPEAVLIRALEPTIGIELMRQRRGVQSLKDLCSGPGKLTRALGITLQDNGRCVTQPPLIVTAQRIKKWAQKDIVQTTRIGLRPDKGADLPLRFYIASSPFVSKRGR